MISPGCPFNRSARSVPSRRIWYLIMFCLSFNMFSISGLSTYGCSMFQISLKFTVPCDDGITELDTSKMETHQSYGYDYNINQLTIAPEKARRTRVSAAAFRPEKGSD